MSYHTKICSLCYSFGVRHKGLGIINAFKDCPITLSHLRDVRADDYKYKPDVYYIRKSDKRFITFQVLASQGKNPKEIIGDILNALLTYQIKTGYFIVGTKDDFKKIDTVLKVSYSILQEIYMLKKNEDLPDLKVIHIESNKSKEDIFFIFDNRSTKDKWFKK